MVSKLSTLNLFTLHSRAIRSRPF